jgi:hypothetical protein
MPEYYESPLSTLGNEDPVSFYGNPLSAYQNHFYASPAALFESYYQHGEVGDQMLQRRYMVDGNFASIFLQIVEGKEPVSAKFLERLEEFYQWCVAHQSGINPTPEGAVEVQALREAVDALRVAAPLPVAAASVPVTIVGQAQSVGKQMGGEIERK